MTNTNVQVNESRKKYLAPVVVLLLCLVSLTGAAYAYSSTVTINGNTADGDYLSIDLRTGTPASDIERVTDLVVFTDHYDYSGDVRQNQIKSEISTQTVLHFKLKIATDVETNPANKVIVKATGINALLNTTFIGEDKFSNYAKFYVNNAESLTNAQELSDAVAGFTFAAAPGNVDIYIIMVAIDGEGHESTDLPGPAIERIVGVQNPAPLVDEKNAAWFAGRIAADINFEFEAKYIAPAP